MTGLRRREISTLEWSVGDSESKPAILTAGKALAAGANVNLWPK
jgi:hypothetical protein